MPIFPTSPSHWLPLAILLTVISASLTPILAPSKLRLVAPLCLAMLLGLPARAEPPAGPPEAVAVAPAPVSPTLAAAAPQQMLPAEARAISTDPRLADPKAGLHELSPWSMFLSADIVVKIVMSLLALASLASWTVLIAKSVELVGAGRTLHAVLRRTAAARSLDEARTVAEGRSVFARLLAAAALEAQLSRDVDAKRGDGIRERAASAFAEIMRGEARSIRRGLGLLATIGSVAPFVGLFGTVWGIMNAFIGISKSQTTNLAVVAPGIAEALLATAVGLVAAIPAVVIYNHFSRQVRGYIDAVAAAAGTAGRLLSRDLDRARDGGDRRFTAAAE